MIWGRKNMNTDTGKIARIVDEAEGRLSLDVASARIGRWFRRLLIFGVIATILTCAVVVWAISDDGDTAQRVIQNQAHLLRNQARNHGILESIDQQLRQSNRLAEERLDLLQAQHGGWNHGR